MTGLTLNIYKYFNVVIEILIFIFYLYMYLNKNTLSGTAKFSCINDFVNSFTFLLMLYINSLSILDYISYNFIIHKLEKRNGEHKHVNCHDYIRAYITFLAFQYSSVKNLLTDQKLFTFRLAAKLTRKIFHLMQG